MPLTQIRMSAGLSWQLARAVPGFLDVSQGEDSVTFAANAIDTAVWSELFAAQYTIGPAGTQTVDLRAFTDLAGNTIAAANKALALIVLVAGGSGDKLNIKPHGTNGLQWFFGGTAEGVNVPGGGMLMFSGGGASTGTTVDATHRQLLLTNTGSLPMTVRVAALVSDV